MFGVLSAQNEFATSIDVGFSTCYSERLSELVEIACGYYKPTGFSYRYNDGCYDRMSGYSMSAESVSVSLVDVARVPAQEKKFLEG